MLHVRDEVAMLKNQSSILALRYVGLYAVLAFVEFVERVRQVLETRQAVEPDGTVVRALDFEPFHGAFDAAFSEDAT